ncbi:hypothetical protein QJS04_geneDACA020750 [Acorus gramineus]|uniref:Uncharacterized protein n=1 Tax=Acorus gramineus TaxID=55184 RepID=A0AAV9A650_ACOGR|nr:hypothetical protein QJS04_geneDACA020750 [Acorus gramineus]
MLLNDHSCASGLQGKHGTSIQCTSPSTSRIFYHRRVGSPSSLPTPLGWKSLKGCGTSHRTTRYMRTLGEGYEELRACFIDK